MVILQNLEASSMSVIGYVFRG